MIDDYSKKDLERHLKEQEQAASKEPKSDPNKTLHRLTTTIRHRGIARDVEKALLVARTLFRSGMTHERVVNNLRENGIAGAWAIRLLRSTTWFLEGSSGMLAVDECMDYLGDIHNVGVVSGEEVGTF